MAVKEHINEYFNGQSFMILCALALIVATAVALLMGVQPVQVGSTGLLFSLKGSLFEAGSLSAAINVLCLFVMGGIMMALNKVFSYIRSVTHLFVSAFFLLQLAHPAGLVSFNVGTLLGLVTVMLILPLFASYQDRHCQRNIFLVFAAISAGSMFHYGFLVLIPAFLLGFINMGVFNLKGLLAMLFGLITPFWITLGMGIAKPADFVLPHIDVVWNLTGQSVVGLMHLLALLIAVTGVVLAVMNLMTIMNYRMQTRVYNAFMVFALVIAVISLCVDFGNVTVYLTLLCIMVAVQIAHTHTLRTSPFRYLLMLLLIAGCLGFYAAYLLYP